MDREVDTVNSARRRDALLLTGMIACMGSGYVFHTDYVWSGRAFWLAVHAIGGTVLLGAVPLVVYARWRSGAGRNRAKRWLAAAFYILAVLLPLSGLIAVWAWEGEIPIPRVLPISYEAGEAAERHHKLFASIFILWAIIAAALFATRLRTPRN